MQFGARQLGAEIDQMCAIHRALRHAHGIIRHAHCLRGRRLTHMGKPCVMAKNNLDRDIGERIRQHAFAQFERRAILDHDNCVAMTAFG